MNPFRRFGKTPWTHRKASTYTGRHNT